MVIAKPLAGLFRRTQGVFVDWREGDPPGYLVCLANRREVYSHSTGLDLVQLSRPIKATPGT